MPHIQRQLQDLRSAMVRMGSLVETAIERAVESIAARDTALARQVIAHDIEADNFETLNEKAIVDLLALHHPVASDLRFILAASKINNDLERIGDHAVNLAQSSLALAGMTRPLPPLASLQEMTLVTRRMLADALDSFIHNDAEMGGAVLSMDDAADELNRTITREMTGLMRTDADAIEQAMELIRVSRNLERVADLATNIAEEVVFIAGVSARRTDGG